MAERDCGFAAITQAQKEHAVVCNQRNQKPINEPIAVVHLPFVGQRLRHREKLNGQHHRVYGLHPQIQLTKAGFKLWLQRKAHRSSHTRRSGPSLLTSTT